MSGHAILHGVLGHCIRGSQDSLLLTVTEQYIERLQLDIDWRACSELCFDLERKREEMKVRQTDEKRFAILELLSEL